MTDCAFCDRIAHERYDFIRSGSDVVSFEPLNPVTPGHRLVVSRAHIRDAAQDPKIAGLVMEWASLIARGGDFNIIAAIGAAATQTIPHLHLHIVPRTFGDGLSLPWDEHYRPPYDELFERLAAIEHERWAAWQRYVHSTCCLRQDDGSLMIPAGTVERWERQIATDYADLSEREKNSDRQQVARYWKLINGD